MSRLFSVAVGVRYSVIPAAAAVTTGMIDESAEAGGREGDKVSAAAAAGRLAGWWPAGRERRESGQRRATQTLN